MPSPTTARRLVNQKQKELAVRKSLIDTDLYRLKYKTRRRLSRPSVLAMSFVSGLCLGMFANRPNMKPVAQTVVTTTLSMVRTLVIIPVVRQFLADIFRHHSRKKQASVRSA